MTQQTLNLIPVADPHVEPVDKPRLQGHSAVILAMLQDRPQSNGDLAKVTPRYGGRIFDIRRAGYRIEKTNLGGGLFEYRFVGER